MFDSWVSEIVLVDREGEGDKPLFKRLIEKYKKPLAHLIVE
ncbi:hypothetical protein N781_09275 [Pontibacillus halophilus JSM 076056 = DSM 19796]|uniref:Uncharacterized protein n=1 Tax=Pontibacillus halophilus JSM 076056 = DSM 19796 TaxID=1385510 RepID=A0A0A5G845_9BACI|nr:hypothetical protein N781_09275 [Pontibacillus halophilus JSM 076056 = DSM 19796]